MKLEGPWYITERAARDYALLFGSEDLEEATEDLIAAARGAHRLREQPSGLVLWRASKEWYRLRFFVGKAPVSVGRAGSMLPALVRVLPPHEGWRYCPSMDDVMKKG